MSLDHHLDSVAKLSLSPLFLWYGTALGIDDEKTDIYVFLTCVVGPFSPHAHLFRLFVKVFERAKFPPVTFFLSICCPASFSSSFLPSLPLFSNAHKYTPEGAPFCLLTAYSCSVVTGVTKILFKNFVEFEHVETRKCSKNFVEEKKPHIIHTVS